MLSLFQQKRAAIEGPSIDLMSWPWVQARAAWTHGSDYSATHAVAVAARECEVQWLSYESARAPTERCAVVFDPDCLFEPGASPDRTIQRWACKASRGSVMFTGNGKSFVWNF